MNAEPPTWKDDRAVPSCLSLLCTGSQHLDHCCFVRAKFHPFCWPLVTPQRSCQDLSLTGWSTWPSVDSKLIIQWWKVRPRETTLQTCWRFLNNKHSNSLRVQCRLCDQEFSNAIMRWNFTCRRCACSWRKSCPILNTVSHVVGPSSLLGCKGTPHYL